jgi:hypothetical protein
MSIERDSPQTGLDPNLYDARASKLVHNYPRLEDAVAAIDEIVDGVLICGVEEDGRFTASTNERWAATVGMALLVIAADQQRLMDQDLALGLDEC